MVNPHLVYLHVVWRWMFLRWYSIISCPAKLLTGMMLLSVLVSIKITTPVFQVLLIGLTTICLLVTWIMKVPYKVMNIMHSVRIWRLVLRLLTGWRLVRMWTSRIALTVISKFHWVVTIGMLICCVTLLMLLCMTKKVVISNILWVDCPLTVVTTTTSTVNTMIWKKDIQC